MLDLGHKLFSTKVYRSRLYTRQTRLYFFLDIVFHSPIGVCILMAQFVTKCIIKRRYFTRLCEKWYTSPDIDFIHGEVNYQLCGISLPTAKTIFAMSVIAYQRKPMLFELYCIKERRRRSPKSLVFVSKLHTLYTNNTDAMLSVKCVSDRI